MRDDILKLIIAPVPDEYTGQLPADGLDLLDEDNGFGVVEVAGLGRENVVNSMLELSGLSRRKYQATSYTTRDIDITMDYLTPGARRRLCAALPLGKPQRLYLALEDDRVLWTDVYPASDPYAINTEVNGSELTLEAESPFFKSLEQRVCYLTSTPQTLINEGDAPADTVISFNGKHEVKRKATITLENDAGECVKFEAMRSYYAMSYRPSIITSEGAFTFDGFCVPPFAIDTELCEAQMLTAEDESKAAATASDSTAFNKLYQYCRLLEIQSYDSETAKALAEEWIERRQSMLTDVRTAYVARERGSVWPRIPPGGTQMHIEFADYADVADSADTSCKVQYFDTWSGV